MAYLKNLATLRNILVGLVIALNVVALATGNDDILKAIKPLNDAIMA